MPKKKSEKAAESKEQGMLFEVEHQEKPFSVVTKVDESLDNIRAELGHCCDLCNNCTHIVFGEGNSKAELMFIGEAPGAEEDAKGRPFVGAAGKLLDKIIEAMGLKR
ncbi:MAG: uracil-DNA glycosylase, partial [Blastocatellia bacterium]|nr:uracil-DNA glycosylase [Blastocatellia bacterium]